MANELLNELMSIVRKSIQSVESSTQGTDERTLVRVLAHLWSAHDELELLSSIRHRGA